MFLSHFPLGETNLKLSCILLPSEKNKINKATLKWSQSCHPRGPTLHGFSNLWDVKTGQINLWTRPKAAGNPDNCLQR